MIKENICRKVQGNNMHLTQQQIQLIKSSWRSFRGVEPKLIADLFYSKLFADNTGVRKMFPKNMDEQYLKIMDMLSSIITRLDKLDELTETIAAMARRHVDYGVKASHYALVGNALLWTLKKGLGNAWTKELEEAWTTCYNMLSATMINASGYPQQAGHSS